MHRQLQWQAGTLCVGACTMPAGLVKAEPLLAAAWLCNAHHKQAGRLPPPHPSLAGEAAQHSGSGGQPVRPRDIRCGCRGERRASVACLRLHSHHHALLLHCCHILARQPSRPLFPALSFVRQMEIDARGFKRVRLRDMNCVR